MPQQALGATETWSNSIEKSYVHSLGTLPPRHDAKCPTVFSPPTAITYEKRCLIPSGIYLPPSGTIFFFAAAPDRPSSASQPLTFLASSESAGTRVRNRFQASVAPFSSPFSFRACPLSKRACA